MNAETRRVKVFSRVLELAAGKRSRVPVPSLWRGWLKSQWHKNIRLFTYALKILKNITVLLIPVF